MALRKKYNQFDRLISVSLLITGVIVFAFLMFVLFSFNSVYFGSNSTLFSSSEVLLKSAAFILLFIVFMLFHIKGFKWALYALAFWFLGLTFILLNAPERDVLNVSIAAFFVLYYIFKIFSRTKKQKNDLESENLESIPNNESE
jgi:hypothetical protein